MCRLVSLGRPGQIGKRLVSSGLMEYNEVIKQKLLVKFPPNPDVTLPHSVQALWTWYSSRCDLSQ